MDFMARRDEDEALSRSRRMIFSDAFWLFANVSDAAPSGATSSRSHRRNASHKIHVKHLILFTLL
jgi:hypothetical protein